MYHIKNDPRALLSTQFLMQALEELLKTQDCRRITVRALATKAGVSRTTFYRNFDEIDDLLRHQIDLDFADLFLAVMAYYREQAASRTALRTAFIRPFLKFWDEHYSTVEVVILAQKESLLLDAFAKHARRVLDASKSQSFLSPEAREYFVAMRSGEAVGLLLYWVKQGRKFDKDALAELVIQQTVEALDMDLEDDASHDSKTAQSSFLPT